MGISVTGGVKVPQGKFSVSTGAAPAPAPSGYALWAWGYGGLGILGNETNVFRSSPVQVGALTDWSSISAHRGNHTAALKTDGTLWSWGQGNNGVIGNGAITNVSSPVQIGALTDWSNISTSFYNTRAIKTDGSLWTWGRNVDGQLGIGTVANKSSPVQVGSLTDWTSTSGGQQHALALKTDGTLWAWGDNFPGGPLGDGTTISKSSPVQIGFLTDWASVSGGLRHSLARKTDGTIWSWGRNTQGNLGHGDVNDRLSPVQIGGLTTWASISAGQDSSHAIKTNGTLWGWGLNSYGKLGIGGTANVSSPVQVGSLTDWANVASGSAGHTFAIKTDGSIWTLGWNAFGQLGDGTLANKSSPVQIGALTDWSSVAVGRLHSLALKTP